MLITGSANRTWVSVVGRTCWVGEGVGIVFAGSTAFCDVEDSAAGSDPIRFQIGLGAVDGAGSVGAPAGRRRGGAFGAAFLPEVAELISVDMAIRPRQHWGLARCCGGEARCLRM